jgi:hypothetical protein
MTANLDSLGTVEGLEVSATRLGPQVVAKPVVLATPHDIGAGSVLIKSDAALPESVHLDSKRYGAWKLVTETDGIGFERTLLEAGWHFFFMVPEIRVDALSSNRNQAMRAALRKALAAVEAQNFNAVEIVNMSAKNVLGLHHVRFVVHARHVKQSPYLRDLDPYHVPRNVWNGKGVLRRRAAIGRTIKGI